MYPFLTFHRDAMAHHSTIGPSNSNPWLLVSAASNNIMPYLNNMIIHSKYDGIDIDDGTS